MNTDEYQRHMALELGETPTSCGVIWPVCPDCIGQGLVERRGTDGAPMTLQCPLCARSWAAAERIPCPDKPSILLSDKTGAAGAVCASHAAHPSAGDLDKKALAS